METPEDELIGKPSEEVPKRDPTDEDCMGKRTDDDGFAGYCRAWPGQGTDHVGEGRCKYHGGCNDGDNGQGGTENNGNAETHGLTSDGEKWFARHRDDVEDDVKQMVADWMQLAPFGWEVSGNVRLLVNAAINECQIERGDKYIEDEGVIVESFVGMADDGRDITEKKENPAFLYKSRLQKDTIRILDKLDVIGTEEATVEVNVHEELLSGLKAAHGEE